MRTAEEMFFEKVILDPNSDCHLWIAAKNHHGYGRFQIKRKGIYAHRFSYEHYIGKIPKDMYVLHKCDIRHCVNPDHLFLGSLQDNTLDMFNKNRNANVNGTNNPLHKLTEKEVIKIRNDIRTCKAIAKQYNISPAQVHRIKRKIQWKHI